MPERSKGVDLKSSGLRPREFESRSGRFGAALRYTCTSGGTRRGRHHCILPGHGAAMFGGQLGFRFESAGQADVHAARPYRGWEARGLRSARVGQLGDGPPLGVRNLI